MLKISNNSLNGIVLGQKKADFDNVTLNDPSYSLEFDRKHKIQSDSQLITVSSSVSCNEFSLDGKIILAGINLRWKYKRLIWKYR